MNADKALRISCGVFSPNSLTPSSSSTFEESSLGVPSELYWGLTSFVVVSIVFAAASESVVEVSTTGVSSAPPAVEHTTEDWKPFRGPIAAAKVGSNLKSEELA